MTAGILTGEFHGKLLINKILEKIWLSKSLWLSSRFWRAVGTEILSYNLNVSSLPLDSPGSAGLLTGFGPARPVWLMGFAALYPFY
jgi:hypothetical protein